MLHTYLMKAWNRLMEQHRILNAKATGKDLITAMKDNEFTETFAVFNTGLENRNGEDIYAVLVQTPSHTDSISPLYTLNSTGIMLQDSCIIKIEGKRYFFIQYLKNLGDDTCRYFTSIEIYRNKNLLKEVKGVLQRASYEKSFSTILSLYEQTRVLPVQKNDCHDTSTHLLVKKDGGFDECVYVTDHAYEELTRLATNERTSDKWTKDSLHRYLKFTWIRLMEQHRIFNARSPHEDTNAKELLQSGGISKTFAAFNTGLVNEVGEDIYAVLVQTTKESDDTSPPYTLFQSGITLQDRGIYITTDKTKKPFIDYLKTEGRNKLSIYHSQGLKSTAEAEALKRASYFKPRDPQLLLDWTLDIKFEAEHIIKQRLDRFLEVGVIDEHEAVVLEEKPCQGNIVYGELKHGKYLHKNKYIRMSSQNATDFYFRRETFGINACCNLLDRWIKDAQKRVQGTFTLAVPQFYYQPPSSSQEYYSGKLQLLIPLFCDTNKAKLALSLELRKTEDGKKEYYKASTVLRIQWAYSNSRLLAAPQATWIMLPEE